MTGKLLAFEGGHRAYSTIPTTRLVITYHQEVYTSGLRSGVIAIGDQTGRGPLPTRINVSFQGYSNVLYRKS